MTEKLSSKHLKPGTNEKNSVDLEVFSFRNSVLTATIFSPFALHFNCKRHALTRTCLLEKLVSNLLLDCYESQRVPTNIRKGIS